MSCLFQEQQEMQNFNPYKIEIRENSMQTKLEQLQTYLSHYSQNSICIAFSGGVDSSLVLKVAAQTVPKVAAVYFQTTLHPVGDQNAAEKIAQEIGVPFYVIKLDEFTNPNIMKNPLDRCYQCKHMLFSILKDWAVQHGYSTCMDGTNLDDLHQYRPGIRALRELDIISPLAECHITKQEVRQIAAGFGLSSSDTPSSPCLATRLPYHTFITKEKLEKIEKAEQLLCKNGFPVNRVRVHDTIARIEIPSEQFLAFYQRSDLLLRLKRIGFDYITLDMEGFRSGSMDEPYQKQRGNQC